MKITSKILAVFHLTNEMSVKAAHKFMANLDYLFTSVVQPQNTVVISFSFFNVFFVSFFEYRYQFK